MRWQKNRQQEADRLGKLAPQFAELNDDVLFGQVWSRESRLSLRDRSMITIAALFSAGLYPQLKSHLNLGKEHGITREEVVEMVTQLAFYCGWPKAWSTFPLIQEVYGDEIVQFRHCRFLWESQIPICTVFYRFVLSRSNDGGTDSNI